MSEAYEGSTETMTISAAVGFLMTSVSRAGVDARFNVFWFAQTIGGLGGAYLPFGLALPAVAEIGASAGEAAALTFCGLLPRLLFTLQAGAYVEKFGRWRSMVYANLAEVAVWLGMFSYTGRLGTTTMYALYIVDFLSESARVVNPIAFQSLTPVVGIVAAVALGECQIRCLGVRRAIHRPGRRRLVLRHDRWSRIVGGGHHNGRLADRRAEAHPGRRRAFPACATAVDMAVGRRRPAVCHGRSHSAIDRAGQCGHELLSGLYLGDMAGVSGPITGLESQSDRACRRCWRARWIGRGAGGPGARPALGRWACADVFRGDVCSLLRPCGCSDVGRTAASGGDDRRYRGDRVSGGLQRRAADDTTAGRRG